MKRPAVAALNTRITLRAKSRRRWKEDTVTSYCEAVTFLLETFATDGVVTETDDVIERFTPPSNSWPNEYAKALQNWSVQCDRV